MTDMRATERLLRRGDFAQYVQLLTADLNKARAALERYGWHDGGCSIHDSDVDGNPECDCGLIAALEASR